MADRSQESILMDEVIQLKRRVADLENKISNLLGALTVAGTGSAVRAQFPPEQMRLSDLHADKTEFTVDSLDM